MKGKAKLIDWMICDDLRREENGKLFFIGVYVNAIVVPVVPVTLPQLVLFSKWDFSGGIIKDFECSIESPDGSLCAKISGSIKEKKDSEKNFILQFGIAPFKFEKTGKYKVVFTIDGAKIDAGGFDVRLKEQPTNMQ